MMTDATSPFSSSLPLPAASLLPAGRRLSGKVAIITGASQGFGQAIALRFIEEGCRVALISLDSNQKTVQMIRQTLHHHHHQHTHNQYRHQHDQHISNSIEKGKNSNNTADADNNARANNNKNDGNDVAEEGEAESSFVVPTLSKSHTLISNRKKKKKERIFSSADESSQSGAGGYQPEAEFDEQDEVYDPSAAAVIDISPCDISDEAQVISAMDRIRDTFLSQTPLNNDPSVVDILVNNAARFVFHSIETATPQDWRNSFDVNIVGTAMVTKHALPLLRKKNDVKKVRKNKNSKEEDTSPSGSSIGSGSGSRNRDNGVSSASAGAASIIFQGSISSFLAQPNCVTYSTAKAAIVQMSRNCAYDLGLKYGIRCNTVCAGTVETPISQKERAAHGWTFSQWEQQKVADVMLGRVGTTREVANACLFYASDESSYCTGGHLMVDGGQTSCTVMPTTTTTTKKSKL